MIVTLIALLFEAYRNIRLKADVDKPYITKRVIQHEVSIRSEAELHLKYPFLKWFRKYVILRLMFCSSFYFMTGNGVILHEMLSVCALGFVWGAIQTNILQRYANTPVVLEVLADLCKEIPCNSRFTLGKNFTTWSFMWCGNDRAFPQHRV